VIASGIWIAAAVLKLTPEAWTNRIPIKMDENKNMEDDMLLRAYNKATAPSAPKVQAAVTKDEGIKEPLINTKIN
jgi:hypothetical protein